MLLLLIVSTVNVLFGVGMVCMPLSDNGPHIAHGWAQVVRLRHLYATRPGMHLLISEGGQIRGSAVQTLHSKWNTLKRRVKRLQTAVFVTNCSVLRRGEHFHFRPNGDSSSGSRPCCHQRGGNRKVSLHRRRRHTVLIGEHNNNTNKRRRIHVFIYITYQNERYKILSKITQKRLKYNVEGQEITLAYLIKWHMQFIKNTTNVTHLCCVQIEWRWYQTVKHTCVVKVTHAMFKLRV